jgi:FlaA1/EpsC-like NDP-sugar epimerase
VEGELLPIHRDILLQTLPIVIVARMFVLMYFGLYGTLISYFSFDDLVKILKGVSLSSILIILLTFLVGERSHPRSVFAIDWFILVFFLVGYRLTFKSLKERVSRDRNEPKENILIYGAGNTGDLALRFMKMRHNGKVVAFIDDDPKKLRKSFQGLKVLGNRYDIESMVRLYHIDKIVIAMHDIDSGDLEQIKSLCEKANVECEVFALAN